MMNGDTYEEGYNGLDEYLEEGGSGSHRSRSRSRSRDRRHCHSSRKRRRHRKRSRSRSRSRERVSGRVHINPNFTNLGPTASSILEANNILEAEVIRLRSELSCTNIRVRALENELSNGTVARGNLEQELSLTRLNYQKLQQTAAKSAQAASSFRSDVVTIRKEKDGVLEILKQTEMQLSASAEQVAFLTKRNEVLGKKCEELVEKNRICREERDDAAQLVGSLKREVENMQSALDLRLLEYKRTEADLNAAREKERMWKIEKLEMERKLTAKDSLIASERRRMEEQKKRDKAQLAELEKKLKCEQPGWESQLGVEAVFNAIEAIKKEFGGQLQQLKDEMIPLKEKSCAIAAYELAANRPARTLSAPPPSDVHITKACQNKQNSLDVIEQSASTNSDSIDRFTEQELIGDVELSEDNPDLAQIDEEELLSDPPM